MLVLVVRATMEMVVLADTAAAFIRPLVETALSIAHRLHTAVAVEEEVVLGAATPDSQAVLTVGVAAVQAPIQEL
jgi:hypothetical protein